MTYEERLTTACGCTEAIEIGAEADARIAELEATMRNVWQVLEAEAHSQADVLFAKLAERVLRGQNSTDGNEGGKTCLTKPRNP